jgi:glycosyltransferase involved in cell wall biosynthesis
MRPIAASCSASVASPASESAHKSVSIDSSSRVAVVGVSIDDPCGVHDHAALLADALAREDIACSLHWLKRTEASIGAERAEILGWARSLGRELEHEPPDAVLLHYSVFALSHRGVPVFVRPVMSALRRVHVPLVSLMHEFAYPWGLGAMRAKAWAATQRVALIDVMHASAQVVVTADDRAEWLRTRPWLPRRAISVAPVFSTLPPGSEPAHARARGGAERIGLFGYAYEGVAVEIVVEALRLLRERGRALELVLLGAPGRDSPAGARWLQVAARNGVADALHFSGRLPAQQLSDELAGCAVLLFAEKGGPTARKTTLAASLSSGRPVVDLDGPNSWAQLRQAQATVVVRPEGRSLANAVARLVDDAGEGERQGELGSAFARNTMSVSQSARIVGDVLAHAIAAAPR